MYLRIIIYISIIFNFKCKSQDDGIVISLRGKKIPNHGLVTTQDIGVDPNGTQLALGLSCSTTSDMCCSDFERTLSSGKVPSGNGSWLYPNKPEYPYVLRQIDMPNYKYGIKRKGNAVYVFRNHLDRTMLSAEDGIWRCIIPDASGMKTTKYIGIYSNETSNGQLSVGTPGNIQFSIVSEDPMVFNLTFYTTGGPATYVTWTRDGVNISLTRDSHYKTLQTVLKKQERSYKDGDYSNTLTVSGRLPGVYAVSVSNDRTKIPVKSHNVSVIDFPLSSISVARSPNFRGIYVSWKLDSLSKLKQTGQNIAVMNTVCMHQGVPDDCVTNSTLLNFTETRYSISNAILWATYNFTITVTTQSTSYNVILPRSISSIIIATDGILAPEIYSVTELANVTTVQVTWRQPEGGLAVDEYVVSYTRLTGRDGQCSSFQDTLNNVIVKAEGEAVTYATSIHVYANSVYSVNITAFSGGLHNTSIPLHFKTNSSAPSKGPQNLTIINSTSTSVTILWDSVECIHRNGLIIQYLLIMDTCDNSNNENFAVIDSSGSDNGGSYTATRLQLSSFAGYLFKVAAINRDGVGPFTAVKTIDGTCGKRSNNATTTGMGIVIAILVLIIAAISVTFTSIWVYKTRVSRPKAAARRNYYSGLKRSLTQNSVEDDELEYDEPTFPSSHYSLQLETCPAYKASET